MRIDVQSRRWCAGLVQQRRQHRHRPAGPGGVLAFRPGLRPGDRLHPRRLPLPAVRPDQRRRLHRIGCPAEQPRRAEPDDHPGGGEEDLPADQHRGHARRLLVPAGRQGHARIGGDGLRRRRPPPRCPHHPALRGHRHREQRRRDHRRGDRTRPHRHQHGGVRGRRLVAQHR